MMEWKQAVALAPRRYDWLADYAQVCLSLKQYAEAGRAWVAAAQAAPNPQLREQYLTARGQIETQRLAQEDEERRQQQAEREAELNRLKAQARAEVAQIEAKANSNPLSKAEEEKAVEWFDTGEEQKVTGAVVRVVCGKQSRLELRENDGTIGRFIIGDISQVRDDAAHFSLSCGVQKPRQVTVSFKPSKDAKRSGVAGTVTAIEVN
jgi:hypothetical protein